MLREDSGDAPTRSRRCRSDRDRDVRGAAGRVPGRSIEHAVHAAARNGLLGRQSGSGRYSGDTHLKSFELIAYFPVHRIFGTGIPGDAGDELGAGIGLFKLTGTHGRSIRTTGGARFHCGAPAPDRALLRQGLEENPKLRRALQAIQLRAGWDFLPGTISSASFNGSTIGEASNEFVATAGVQFDLGTLLWAAANKEKPK